MLTMVVREAPAIREAMGTSVTMCFVIFYCASVLCFFFGVFLKVKVYISLMRRRREEFDDGVSKQDDYTQKHAKLLADVKRSLKLTYAAVSTALLEDLPMGILGMLYIITKAKHAAVIVEDRCELALNALLFWSTATSFFSLVCVCVHACSGSCARARAHA